MSPRTQQWIGGLLAAITYAANTVYINAGAGQGVIAQGPDGAGRMQAAFWLFIYLGVAVFIVGTIWRFLKGPGAVKFWKVAGRFPDEAYE